MTLPKFLLAWADFNWFWVFAKLRPARNENWSALRTLGLTALAWLIGATVGLVLSFLFFRQPTGWLPWLLGLASACFTVCWFGVTALCWNQRVAQLRAAQNYRVELPKARYPFFRWCLGFVYFALLGLFTPFALMVTVENVRAEFAWKRERARLVAAGEKLTFSDLLGPPIPSAQNAGAAAVFAPFFDYQNHAPILVKGDVDEIISSSGLVWSQSNQLARLERIFHTPANYLPEKSKASRTNGTTPKIEIADWSAAYRKLIEKPLKDDVTWASEIKLPAPGDPARDVLAALSLGDKELAEVCAAATLPRAQFPNHYDEAFAALLRHLSTMKGVQNTLQLRCAAHLAVGETEAAFADATNALNVANLLREEPILISQLVHYAQISIALNTFWQGLPEHRWSDSQLAQFQRSLAQLECSSSIVVAMEGERAFAITGLDLMVRDPQAYDNFMGPPPLIMRVLRVIPRSILRQNEVYMIRTQSAALVHLREVIAKAPQTGLSAAAASREAQLESYIKGPYSPYTAMFNTLAPAVGKAINMTSRTETAVRLASVACALERYRLAHGNFPEKLEQLSPESVGDVLNDPMVNQPFRYQRTDDGWYQLYSVGLNGKDDGGKPSNKENKEDDDWPWPVPARPEKFRLF